MGQLHSPILCISFVTMKVYLIRHAQSEENVLDLRVYTTINDFNNLVRRSHTAPLTSEGERQAYQVVKKLATARIERLYSSPFVRTLATARTIGAAFGLTPELVDDLREVLPRPMSERRRPGSLRRLLLQSYLEMFWPWGAGETWLLSYRRAQTVWAQLTSEPVTEMAIVSHRGLISLILFSLRHRRDWQVLTSDISNGGISIVTRTRV